MNIYFTKNKKLLLDEHYNLLYDGQTTNEQYKEICKTLPLRVNGEKPSVIAVAMGSVDVCRPNEAFTGSDLIELLKLITEQVERSHKQDVYIWEGSTLSDFCYCVLGGNYIKENVEK